MRKLYLILLFITGALSAKAQNLEILHADSVNCNGDTLEMTLMPQDTLKKYLMVANTSDQEMSVLVKKEEVLVQDSTENTFCWGFCYSPQVSEAQSAIAIAAHDTNTTDFYLDFYPHGVEGTNNIRLVFFNEAHTDTATVMMQIEVQDTTATGIATKAFSREIGLYPVPAEDYLHIRTGKATDARFRVNVYDLAGKRMLQRSLQSTSGVLVLPVRQIKSGVYILELRRKGYRSTQKFIKR